MSVSTPIGRSVSATYSGWSYSSVADHETGTSSLGADSQGDYTTVSTPLGYTTNVTYDAARRPTLAIEPNVSPNPRVATRTTYDVLGRTTKVERGSYAGTTFTPIETYTIAYDAVGNKIQRPDPPLFVSTAMTLSIGWSARPIG